MLTFVSAYQTPEGPSTCKVTEAYRETYYPDCAPLYGTGEWVDLPSFEDLMAIAAPSGGPTWLQRLPAAMQRPAANEGFSSGFGDLSFR